MTTETKQLPLWVDPGEIVDCEGDHYWVRLSDDFHKFKERFGVDWRALWTQMPVGRQVVDKCAGCGLLNFTTEMFEE